MKTIVLVFTVLTYCTTVHAQANSRILQGNQYYRQSQFDMAEAEYRKALEAEPSNTTAQFNLANALQKQKKFDEAVKVLGALAATSTDKSFRSIVWYNQGVAYTKLKNLEESIEAYKKSLRLNPDDQQARENLEKALLELKKKQQQQKDQQKKQDPKMSEKEAEQKLKMLQQKERELQQRQQNKKQQGAGQAQDW
ncbi:MAG TPA: tetratricopeptide repeat protein [Flavisolibacter sp.]|nr:tetratricopeptide repeat protein [Flavisolibacter sp.]